jgi:arabinan endo-1,5-alpha-L-arabinosidase
MYSFKQYRIFILFFASILVMASSCEPEEPILDPPKKPDPDPDTTVVVSGDPIDFSVLTDTYWATHTFDHHMEWGMHNVHDPVIRKFGDYFYSYSTDVAYGTAVRLGHQIRRTRNLVEWEFVGWVFEQLPAKGKEYIESIGATPNNGLWAPSVIEVDGKYRLYYSLASDIGLKSCIGLATSSDPAIGWEEEDLVVTTDGSSTQTNAIDPSVIITPGGEHWMMYGSSWDGIYLLQLDPVTGLARFSGDRGNRVAHRGSTNGKINGNIEGAEVIYNQDEGMFYLFIAYDWLSTKYNVRVARSASVQGPYLDYFGNDVNVKTDNYPMILAPYKFTWHAGWQGVGHCTVFEDKGQYFIGHQARPGQDTYYMDMHVRQMFWTGDGWPVVSPERYANQALQLISENDIIGQWETIDFEYKVVPGFDKEQTSPDFQTSGTLRLNDDWTINESETDNWAYTHPWLSMNLDGISLDVHVSVGRDWEKNIDSTLVFTGNSTDGMPFWGKKTIEN